MWKSAFIQNYPFKAKIIITARKRSLGRGNIFVSVCHSVHRGEYLGRYTPQAGIHPPGQVHPPAMHAGIRSTSERYASYWNAFLFLFSCRNKNERNNIVQFRHSKKTSRRCFTCWLVDLKQECIPVGCVPPACWPYPIVSHGGWIRGGLHRGVSSPPWSCDLWCMLGSQPPPWTNTCENITLPQTSFAGGNYVTDKHLKTN